MSRIMAIAPGEVVFNADVITGQVRCEAGQHCYELAVGSRLARSDRTRWAPRRCGGSAGDGRRRGCMRLPRRLLPPDVGVAGRGTTLTCESSPASAAAWEIVALVESGGSDPRASNASARCVLEPVVRPGELTTRFGWTSSSSLHRHARPRRWCSVSSPAILLVHATTAVYRRARAGPKTSEGAAARRRFARLLRRRGPDPRRTSSRHDVTRRGGNTVFC